jgi:hypothetical protein
VLVLVISRGAGAVRCLGVGAVERLTSAIVQADAVVLGDRRRSRAAPAVPQCRTHRQLELFVAACLLVILATGLPPPVGLPELGSLTPAAAGGDRVPPPDRGTIDLFKGLLGVFLTRSA